MKEFSVGVSLAWQIAAAEAIKTQYQYIEKEHLLIGIFSLGKTLKLAQKIELNDKDQQVVQTEYNVIEEVLHGFAINASQIRRNIRQRLGIGNYNHTKDILHRSEACKQVFQRTNGFIESTEPTSCLHLLAALLEDPGDVINSVFQGGFTETFF
jgi:ATP-dependent Clp protease ATP-binding subunit ClpC